MKKYVLFLLCQLFFNGLFAKEKITLEDIWQKGTFKSESVAGFKSMNNGNYYSEISAENKLQKVSFKTGKVKSILADFNNLQIDTLKIHPVDYEFSADEKKILLFTEAENIYRRSILYNAFYYDIASKTIIRISPQKVLHPTFSPDGKKLAYVQNNNIYLMDIGTTTTEQITKDGEKNKIINGNCDWVYEEEFGFSKALEWSPDGTTLAYYKFNETNVKEYTLPFYEDLYPRNYTYKYPKAGEENSKVQICKYNIISKKTLDVNIGNDEDYYIPRIKWNPFNNNLIVYKMNRLQNKLQLYSNEKDEEKSNVIYEENNAKYIEIKDEIYFYKTKNAFIYTSERNGFTHLFLHNIDQNTSTQLTNGNWEVTDLHGVDEAKSIVYYTSTENSPLERNLYSIHTISLAKQNITPQLGTNIVQFSKDFSYFLNTFSLLNTPPVYSILNNKGKLIRVLKTNNLLQSKLAEYTISPQELIKVPNENGDTLNAWILKPQNVNDGNKHPLLMFQYSGPGSQQVSNSWMGRDYFWYQMLAQKGYIIACVDGRGTGFRGENFKKCTYLQLGNKESDDQIAAAKYFGKLPFVDSARIGIWGWSYGGYMSSICLAKGANVFKSAIAVAPVTNWRYYDNIYTERYMRTPQENASGYDENSPVNMVNAIKGNYLLIHGTADDNVHYQNSMMMIDALIKANKEFDSEAYTNKAHGISGGNTRYHLYKRLTKFIEEKL